jgi:hypothetical protein
LLDTFAKLFGLYPETHQFQVVYTANAVLVGGYDGQFSLWHGQTCNARGSDLGLPEDDDGYEYAEERAGGKRRKRIVKFNDAKSGQVNYTGFDIVRNLGDVESLPTQFSASEFERLFLTCHDESNVSVHSVVNYIYIIRGYLSNYALYHTRADKKIQTLF